MRLKIWKAVFINIILMIIFMSVMLVIDLKINIIKINLNYFVLPVFCAVLFGSIITYLVQKKIMGLEERIKEKTRELSQYTSIDDKTNTYNRKMGLEMLKNHLSLSRRHKNNLSVCLIDLNGLKSVNESFGYAMGDELIKDVSEMLRSSIRESDIISRMGGDEFLTVLPECDIIGARKVMRRLTEKIKIYNENSLKNYNASISFGISESSYCDKKTVEYLLSEADSNMHAMKKRKKSTSCEKLLCTEESKDNVLIFKLWVIIL